MLVECKFFTSTTDVNHPLVCWVVALFCGWLLSFGKNDVNFPYKKSKLIDFIKKKKKKGGGVGMEGKCCA